MIYTVVDFASHAFILLYGCIRYPIHSSSMSHSDENHGWTRHWCFVLLASWTPFLWFEWVRYNEERWTTFPSKALDSCLLHNNKNTKVRCYRFTDSNCIPIYSPLISIKFWKKFSLKKGIQSKFKQKWKVDWTTALVVNWSPRFICLSKLASLKSAHRKHLVRLFYIDKDKCNDKLWRLNQPVNF